MLLSTMKKKINYFSRQLIYFVITCLNVVDISYCQDVVSIVIKDSVSGVVLPYAKVYYSDTTMYSDKRGELSVVIDTTRTDCPLVISYVGYETRRIHVEPLLNGDNTIIMVPHNTILDTTIYPIIRKKRSIYNPND